MKVSVDVEACIGCGSCEAVCPECFELVDGKSRVKSTCSDNCKCCEEAEDICPVDAIKIEK